MRGERPERGAGEAVRRSPSPQRRVPASGLRAASPRRRSEPPAGSTAPGTEAAARPGEERGAGGSGPEPHPPGAPRRHHRHSPCRAAAGAAPGSGAGEYRLGRRRRPLPVPRSPAWPRSRLRRHCGYLTPWAHPRSGAERGSGVWPQPRAPASAQNRRMGGAGRDK